MNLKMTSADKQKYSELIGEYGGTAGPNPGETKALFEFIRWKCMTDLFFLGTEMLGLAKEPRRVFPPFHRWLAQVLSLEGSKMIMVPRKHAKTTWTETRIVQLLLRHAGRCRILMLSKTAKISKDSLAAIKRHLTRSMLQIYFPEVIPEAGANYKNWFKSTQTELRMKEDMDWIAKEPQIMAYGSLASFTGSAVDYIVMDDYVDDDTCRSVTKMVKAVEDWRYLQSIVEVTGEFIIIGTFYHYNDLYNTIIKEKHIPQNRIFIRRAIENGNILYKGWFTKKHLDNLKTIEGNYVFSCQYMLDPIPKEDQIFPGPQPTCIKPPEDKYRRFIMVDPAPTINQKSDSTGIVVASINSRKHIYFEEAFSVKLDGAAKVDLLIKLCLQYRPEKVGVEYGLQQDLEYIIKHRVSEYERRNQVRVPALMCPWPIKVNNKQSKGDRIYLTLGAFVRSGHVQIVESKCRELIQQMDIFTGKGNEKDDVVDAASMLFPLVGEFASPSSLIERIDPSENSFYGIFKKPAEEDSWWSNFGVGRKYA